MPPLSSLLNKIIQFNYLYYGPAIIASITLKNGKQKEHKQFNLYQNPDLDRTANSTIAIKLVHKPGSALRYVQ